MKRPADFYMIVYRGAVAALQYAKDVEPLHPVRGRAATRNRAIKRPELLEDIRELAARCANTTLPNICPEHRVSPLLVDLQDRDLRAGIAHGVTAGQWPTILNLGTGYYLARGPVEINEAAEYIRSYLKANAKRLAGLEHAMLRAGGTPMFPEYNTKPSPCDDCGQTVCAGCEHQGRTKTNDTIF